MTRHSAQGSVVMISSALLSDSAFTRSSSTLPAVVAVPCAPARGSYSVRL